MLKNKASLFQKLFILICIILLLIVLPLFYLFRTSLTQFGSYAHKANTEQIQNLSGFYLSRIATEQAGKYDEIFKKIKIVSSLMGNEAARIYQNFDVLSQNPLKGSANLEPNPETRIFYSPEQEAVITVYWGDDVISEGTAKELAALSHFKPMLVTSGELVHESLATHIITASGIGCYYTLNIAARNACYHLPPVSEFDIRDGEPVTLFTKQKIKYPDTQWTRIYKDDVIDGLMMTAATPVYDRTGTFKGITGIDIPVRGIIKDLNEGISASKNADETILFAFLLDKKGKFIAFPKNFSTLFGLDLNFPQFKNSSDILNYSLEDSSMETVQKAGRQILNNPGGMIEVKINKERYILATGCLKSVEWHLILVAREADMTASVHNTGIAMEKSLGAIWKNFVGLFGFIMAIAVILIFYVVQVFIAPIKQFITATRKVAEGDFSVSFQTAREDEIGLLARSFNTMVQKLKISGENIVERTAQLKRLNEHLVYTEEGTRKAIASDLHDSVSQTLAMSISTIKNIRESDGHIRQGDLHAVQGYLEQAVHEVRSLIYQLSPPILDDFDIEIALGFLIEETNAAHHSCFHYINNIENSIYPDPLLKVTLYRAVNELLTNILKHSGSKKGEVEIFQKNETLWIRVEDQGTGFDTNKIKSSDALGFGLHSLAERMENFNGKMEVSSKPGIGTKILLTAPVSLDRKEAHEKN